MDNGDGPGLHRCPCQGGEDEQGVEGVAGDVIDDCQGQFEPLRR